MRRKVLPGLLLIFAVGALPALADGIDEDTDGRLDKKAPKAGPMEYIEVTETLDVTGAARAKAEQERAQRKRLLEQNRREQVEAVRQTQLVPLQQLREKLAKTPEEQRRLQAEQEAARAEALRRQQEDERARTDQQRQEPQRDQEPS